MPSLEPRRPISTPVSVVRPSGPQRAPSARSWHPSKQDPFLAFPFAQPESSESCSSEDEDSEDELLKHLTAAATRREPQLRRMPASRNLANRRSQSSRSPDGRIRYSLSKSPLWQNRTDGGFPMQDSVDVSPRAVADAFPSFIPSPDATSPRTHDRDCDTAASLTTQQSHTASQLAATSRVRTRRTSSLHSIRARFFFPPSFKRPPASSISRDSNPTPPQDTSSFTISDFPRPPARLPFLHADARVGESLGGNPHLAPAPTTYHFRGASFDLVNPHHSLCLHTIETPDDTERAEYIFPAESLHAMTNRRPPGAKTPSVVSSDDDDDAGSVGNQRFFNDFTSAHSSITRKSSRPVLSESESVRPSAVAQPAGPAQLRQSRRTPVADRHGSPQSGAHHNRLPDSERQSAVERLTDDAERDRHDVGAHGSHELAAQQALSHSRSAEVGLALSTPDDTPPRYPPPHVSANLEVPCTPSHSPGQLSRTSSNGAIIDAYRYNESENNTPTSRIVDSAAEAARAGTLPSTNRLPRRSPGQSTIGSIIRNYENLPDANRRPSPQARTDIRHATARALGGYPGNAPSDSLPSNPSPAPTRRHEAVQSPTDTNTLAPSYTDTSQVLATPTCTEAEKGKARCANPQAFHYPRRTGEPLQAPDSSSSSTQHMEESPDVATSPDPAQRTSQFCDSVDWDDRMAQDCQRFSNLSEQEGSVFIVYPSGGAMLDAANEGGLSTSPRAETDDATQSAPSTSPADGVCAPVAAFSASHVAPGNERHYGSRPAYDPHSRPCPPPADTYSDSDYGNPFADDDQDWVTEADSRVEPTSRYTFADDDSYADSTSDTLFHGHCQPARVPRMPRALALRRRLDPGAQTVDNERAGDSGSDRLAQPSSNQYNPPPLSTLRDNPEVSPHSHTQFAGDDSATSPPHSSRQPRLDPHALAQPEGQGLPHGRPRSDLSVVDETAEDSDERRERFRAFTLSCLDGEQPLPADTTEYDLTQYPPPTADPPQLRASRRLQVQRNSATVHRSSGQRRHPSRGDLGEGSSRGGALLPRSPASARQEEVSGALVRSGTDGNVAAEEPWSPSQQSIAFRDAMLEATRRSSRAWFGMGSRQETLPEAGESYELEDLGASVRTQHSRRPLLASARRPQPGPRLLEDVEPALRRRDRTPQAVVDHREARAQRLSTVVLVLFCLCPPLLVFYGMGGFDPLLAVATHGDIQSFTSRSKRLALYMGWPMSGLAVVVPLVWLIVIKAVPNSYP